MKREHLNISDYQSFVTAYHGESDRAAIVMAGSFAEHYLATFIRDFMIEDEDVERLFASGPLSSFDARINIAYAFSLIEKPQRDDLRIIKSVRNRFAHSPRAISLKQQDIAAEIEKLTIRASMEELPNPTEEQKSPRFLYLITVGLFVIFANQHMERRKKKKQPAPTRGNGP